MEQTDLYVYGFIGGGERRRLVFGDLVIALYQALGDLHDGEATPLGIRRGRRVLYRKADLERLYAEHRDALAAGRDVAVLRALMRIEAP
jgi:hypothetical protein